MSLVREGTNGTAPGNSLWLWCPGCNDSHRIVIDCEGGWGWNGSLTTPTINPSILVHSHGSLDENRNYYETPRCHSFVTGGQWHFLEDSTHALAGQTVDMVELPDWLDKEYVGEPKYDE